MSSKPIITNDAAGNVDHTIQRTAFFQAFSYSLELCSDPETARQVAMLYLQNCGIRGERSSAGPEFPRISARKHMIGMNYFRRSDED